MAKNNSQFTIHNSQLKNVEWKTLGEVAQRTNNIKWDKTHKTCRYIDLSSVCRDRNIIIDTTVISSKNAPSRAKKLVLENDVIFATTRPTQMRYCLIPKKFSGDVASTGYCVLRAKPELVLPKWILHWVSTTKFKVYLEENQSGSAYPAISDSKVKEFQIPIPPLKIQKEIVRILDTFTELTAELKTELTARKKQYGYYRDSLLSFLPQMNTDKHGFEVEWKTLGEVGEFTYGYATKAQKTGDARFIRISDINENGKLIPTDSKFVDVSDENKKYLLKKGDLLMARTGATYGKTLIFEEDYTAIYAGFLIKLHFDNKLINPKFYWHIAQSDLFWHQANKLVSGGGQPQFNANALKMVKIPIPPLAEQERIVSILDKFDTLTTSISEGLPREIELRKKQYEYYRDKLLTFPNPTTDAHR